MHEPFCLSLGGVQTPSFPLGLPRTLLHACAVQHLCPPSARQPAHVAQPPPARIHICLLPKTRWTTCSPVSRVSGPRKQERSLLQIGSTPCPPRTHLSVNDERCHLSLEKPEQCVLQSFPSGLFPQALASVRTFGLKGNGISPSIFFLDDRSVIGIRA